jgi:hypothetical protein
MPEVCADGGVVLSAQVRAAPGAQCDARARPAPLPAAASRRHLQRLALLRDRAARACRSFGSPMRHEPPPPPAPQGLPFSIAGVGDLLALFRCVSCRYRFSTDVMKPALQGAIGRVYLTCEVRAPRRPTLPGLPRSPPPPTPLHPLAPSRPLCSPR